MTARGLIPGIRGSLRRGIVMGYQVRNALALFVAALGNALGGAQHFTSVQLGRIAQWGRCHQVVHGYAAHGAHQDFKIDGIGFLIFRSDQRLGFTHGFRRRGRGFRQS